MRALMGAVIVMGILIVVGTTILIYEIVRRGSDKLLNDKNITITEQPVEIQMGASLLEKGARILNIYTLDNAIVIHSRGPEQKEFLTGVDPRTGKARYKTLLKE